MATPYVKPCPPMPVYVVGGTVTGGAGGGTTTVQNQFESLFVTRYCDPATGNLVAYGAVIRQEATGTATATSFFDPQQQPIAALPAGAVACQPFDDIHWTEKCFFEGANPTNRFRMLTGIPYINGVRQAPMTLFVNDAGAIVTPPSGLNECPTEGSSWIHLPLCATDATTKVQTPFYRWFQVDESGTVRNTLDRDGAGTAAYTVPAGATVEVCGRPSGQLVCYRTPNTTVIGDFTFVPTTATKFSSSTYGNTVMTLRTTYDHKRNGASQLCLATDPNSPQAVNSLTLDFTKPIRNVVMRFSSLGIGEQIRNISPQPASVTGNNLNAAANYITAVGGTGDGTITWPQGTDISQISLDVTAQPGGGEVFFDDIDFVETNPGEPNRGYLFVNPQSQTRTLIDLITGSPAATYNIVSCDPTPQYQAGGVVCYQAVGTQQVSYNFSWLPAADATITTSPAQGTQQITATIETNVGHRLIGATGARIPIVTPGQDATVTLRFSKQITNLSVDFSSLNNTEVLRNFNPLPAAIQNLVNGTFQNGVVATTGANSTATGIMFWPGPLSQVSFNLGDTANGTGIIIMNLLSWAEQGGGPIHQGQIMMDPITGKVSLYDLNSRVFMSDFTVVDCDNAKPQKPPATLTAAMQQVNGTNAWTPGMIPAGYALVALSVLVQSAGTNGVIIVDGVLNNVADVPSGWSGNWEASPDGTLIPPGSIQGKTATDKVFVTLTLRKER